MKHDPILPNFFTDTVEPSEEQGPSPKRLEELRAMRVRDNRRRSIVLNRIMLAIPAYFNKLTDQQVTEGVPVEVIVGDFGRRVHYNLAIASLYYDFSKMVGPSLGAVDAMPALRFEAPEVCKMVSR